MHLPKIVVDHASFHVIILMLTTSVVADTYKRVERQNCMPNPVIY